jgi:hypothetical protein
MAFSLFWSGSLKSWMEMLVRFAFPTYQEIRALDLQLIDMFCPNSSQG